MKDRLTRSVLIVLALWLLPAGAATAAGSPTVTIDPAGAVGASSATLHGTISPNGSRTVYHFSFGPTSALGASSPTRTAGAGTKPVKVADTLGGLQSGTTYYVDLVAANAAGTVITKTITFKTAGPPPAQATTGAATVLSSSSVELTGVVAPEGAVTTYYFELGSAAGSYELRTAPATIAPSSSPVPVSVTVTGLEPGTVFHYALVATHGGINSGSGADASFETFPRPVPRPRVLARTTPRLRRGRPFVFSTRGRVLNRTRTSDTLACTGVATVAFYDGRHRIARQLAPLTPTCEFAARTVFAHLLHHRRRVTLLVYVRFDGNGYLRAVALRPERVTLG
jgi:hypothetical protein